MKYCKKCLMPDTRPGTNFDKEGVCQACNNYELRKKIDWEKRRQELVKLCDKYRRKDGYYDCIVPVSGGKDSTFQVYFMKEEMGMNPLLLTIGDPFTKTKAGLSNFRNLGDTFSCDHILFNMSIDMLRRAMRVGFEESAHPLQFIEASCYTVSFRMAAKLGIPLVVFGENPEYEYGTVEENKHSANQYILDGLSFGIFKSVDFAYWEKHGISKNELNAFVPPTEEELARVRPEVIFMSYFLPWSSLHHQAIAIRYGFRGLANEWKREGNIEDFEQIDSIAYMVHFWLKYPKFGFQRVSDIVSRRIRQGVLTAEEGMRLIMEYDHKLDQWSLDDFLGFLGYTPREFWDIVEKFWNREIFEKLDGVWRLKDPVYKSLIKGERYA